jgi:hypothetical protein
MHSERQPEIDDEQGAGTSGLLCWHRSPARRPRPRSNSTGDREMLEWTGARLLLLHDDVAREYAYGPAQGLADTKVGTFTQALYDEAKQKGWIVISMKNDWNEIFPHTTVGRGTR